MEEEALERRLRQEHIVDWLVNAVKMSVTPTQVRVQSSRVECSWSSVIVLMDPNL